MGTEVFDLVAVLKADIAGYESGMKRAAQVTADSSKSMGEKLAGIGKYVAVAGAAVGAAAIKMAGDFEQQTTTLVTGAGESAKTIGMVRDAILTMAVDTGTSTKQLTDGMFMIASAGYHGADGLKVLKAAAEGAKVGNADLGTVANAVTTVMKDYSLKASDAALATNFLVTVVSQGKTHMEDLAGSLSAILPFASGLHLSLADIGGAMAQLTEHGVPAAKAATSLKFELSALIAPTGPAKDALKSIGLSATDLGETLTTKGLGPALQQLQDHLSKKFPQGGADAIAAMTHILGGARGLGAGLLELGTHLPELEGHIKSVGDSMVKGGDKVTGWARVQKDFNFKLDQAKEVVQTLAIKLGTLLIPVVEKVASAVEKVVDWFTKHKTAAEALGVVVGGFLVTAFAAFLALKVESAVQGIVGAFRFLTTGTSAAAVATDGLTASELAAGTAADGLAASEGAAAAGGLAFLGPAALVAAAAYGIYYGLTHTAWQFDVNSKGIQQLSGTDMPQLAEKMAAMDAATGKTTASQQTFNAVLQKSPEKAQQFAVDLYRLTGNLKEYRDMMKQIPATVDTTVNLNMAGAQAAIAQIRGQIATLDGSINSNFMAGVNPTGAYAPTAHYSPFGVYLGTYGSGGTVPGPVGQPGWAIVHGGERIQTAAQARSGGGQTIVINVTGALSQYEARRSAARVQTELTKLTRTGG